MEKYAKREDVPTKYKWDLTVFCKDPAEFKKRIESLETEIASLNGYRDALKSSDRLYEFMEKSIEIIAEIENLEVYAKTFLDQDLRESEPKELFGMIERLESKYNVATSFFEPSILKLSVEEYKALVDTPKLAKYKAYFDKLYRHKPHVLSESEEKIAVKLTETMSSFEVMSSTILDSLHDYGSVELEDGTKEKLSSTNYKKLMKKLPRNKRKETYLQYNKVLDQYSSINANLLDDYVKTCSNIAEIYKYNSSWEQYLFGSNLNDKIFDSLVSSALKSKDVIKKYWDLKKDVLHLDELMPWDGVLELYETNHEYTIEDAQKIALKAIEPLGEEYKDEFAKIFSNRAVDYAQYEGKTSGGYNISSIGKADSLILMSFNNDLESVSTLVHEGGHYVNNSLITKNNDLINRGFSPITAEVASLTNECLLSHYLVNNRSKDEALAGLSNMIGTYMSNFYGAVLEGEIEREFYKYVSEGGTLTKEYLNDLCEKNLLKFYPLDKLRHEYEANMWVTRSHYFMNFYLFSYAVCIAVATHVASEIINGNEDMLKKYIDFLKIGSDVWPIDAFKKLGIDIEKIDVYESSIKYFDSLLSEFRRVLEKE